MHVKEVCVPALYRTAARAMPPTQCIPFARRAETDRRPAHRYIVDRYIVGIYWEASSPASGRAPSAAWWAAAAMVGRARRAAAPPCSEHAAQSTPLRVSQSKSEHGAGARSRPLLGLEGHLVRVRARARARVRVRVRVSRRTPCESTAALPSGVSARVGPLAPGQGVGSGLG